MARLEDPRKLQLFQEALEEGARGVVGYVQWKKRCAEWVRETFDGITSQGVVALMRDHARAGKKIDEVRERRPEYAAHREYHYDFRLFIAGKHTYIETILDETTTGPMITVVSIHPV